MFQLCVMATGNTNTHFTPIKGTSALYALTGRYSMPLDMWAKFAIAMEIELIVVKWEYI